MQEYGSIAYANERAKTFVMAADLDLAQFEESSPRRALGIVAEYMVNRDR
jgi:octaprenyl-diphosphate synthase